MDFLQLQEANVFFIYIYIKHHSSYESDQIPLQLRVWFPECWKLIESTNPKGPSGYD